ncbi:MAG: hypothetical protein KF745_11920 [Phycisphaeraceae bacterium]|nr:hypothetical protein [Phycisphaeraceae bacterium]
MAGRYRASGRVSVLAAVVTPLLLGIAAVLGAVCQAAIMHNPWGVANPLLTAMAAFALGAVVVGSSRAAKVRNVWVGLLIGVAASASFLAAGYWAAYLIDPLGSNAGVSVWGYLAQRRAAGVPLFGGAWRASGGWLWTAWILEGVLVVCAGMFPGTVEAGRPFCERCCTWARKSAWKYAVPNPGAARVAAMRSATDVGDLIGLPGGSSDGERLEYTVGTCRCGRMATLGVEQVTPGTKDPKQTTTASVVTDMMVSRGGLERLFAWAESGDPGMAARRPVLNVSGSVVERQSFDLIPKPEGEEYVSTWRWSSAVVARDSTADNEYTKPLRKRLDAGDFAAAGEALRAQRRIEDLAYVAEACADWAERPLWLEDWLDETPTAAAPRLIRGINGVKWAWVARGGGWKAKNPDLFIARLDEAEQDLLEATERAPRDPTAWAWLVYAAIGLGHDLGEAQRRLDAAHRLAPFHRPAHTFMLQYLCEKWYGSHESMFAFARRTSAAAPPGSTAHVVVVEAHLERWGWSLHKEGRAAAAGYWKTPEVRAEIVQANDRCFRTGGFKVTMDTARARNFFAYALWKVGEHHGAAEHLRVIGTSSPWGPWSAPLGLGGDTLKRARRECVV